uniref:Integrase family protein n=1 Tax=Sphingobacterium sp. (strain 21) TaxID=743722 RepID=F4C2B7_SPHS2
METGTHAIHYYLVADSKISANGNVKIYLRFIHHKQKTDFYTGIRWPKELFDKEKQVLLPRHTQDMDVEAYNLMLAQQKGIAHRLQLDAFMDGRQLTTEMYVTAIKSFKPVGDFVAFTNNRINYEYNKEIISNQTWRNQRNCLRQFIDFWGSPLIPFHEITQEKIREYDAYLRKLDKSHNTITGYHKVIRKFLNAAEKQNIIKVNPYNGLTFRYVPGSRRPLEQVELKRLMDIYYKKPLMHSVREVLRRFLFSCLTGVRISDSHRLHRNMIVGNKLTFKMKKTERYGRTATIPLPKAALDLVEGQEGYLFTKFADKTINEYLKVIAVIAGIEKNLTYHCARDTFGTIFIELGGDIKSLCDIMGHSDTRITEIYLKMSDQRKQNLMNNFDLLFG